MCLVLYPLVNFLFLILVYLFIYLFIYCGASLLLYFLIYLLIYLLISLFVSVSVIYCFLVFERLVNILVIVIVNVKNKEIKKICN